jgi:hypothetical protein
MDTYEYFIQSNDIQLFKMNEGIYKKMRPQITNRNC